MVRHNSQYFRHPIKLMHCEMQEYFYVTIDESRLYNLFILWMGVQNSTTG